MAKDFKQTDDFPVCEWKDDQLASDASKVYLYTVARAKEASDWYFTTRKSRQFGCRALRLGIIGLTAFAALVPLQEGLLKGKPIDPLCSAIALILAGTLLAIDRFYGCTTGWIRYMLTGQQLVHALELFQFDCERLKLSWKQAGPTREQAAVFLSQCRSFLSSVHGMVGSETRAWAAEFGEVIRQLDEQVKAAQQAAQRGAIHLTVGNGTQCPEGWSVSVGGLPAERHTGTETTVDVPPGLHVVTVECLKDGRTLRAERGVTVRPGEIADAAVELA